MADNSITQVWVNELINAIGVVLRNLIPDDDVLNRYLTNPENAATWAMAFLERSVSRTNNEVLEYAGDRRFNNALMKYVLKKYPGWDENAYTQVDNRYKSKFFHHKVMEELGLLHLYRSIEGNTGKLKRSSDVLEAFVGALGVVGDRTEAKFLGVSIGGDARIYQFVKFIFRNIKIDMEWESLQPAKIFVGQFFDRIGFPLDKFVKDRSGNGRRHEGAGGLRIDGGVESGSIRYTFALSPEQVNFLNGILNSTPFGTKSEQAVDVQFKSGRPANLSTASTSAQPTNATVSSLAGANFNLRTDRDGFLIIAETITHDPESEYSAKTAEMAAWQEAANALISRGFTEQWIELWVRKEKRNSPELHDLIIQAEMIAKSQDRTISEIYLYHGAKVEKPKALIQLIAILGDGSNEKSIFQYLISDSTISNKSHDRDALLEYIKKYQTASTESGSRNESSQFTNSTFNEPTNSTIEEEVVPRRRAGLGGLGGRARSRGATVVEPTPEPTPAEPKSRTKANSTPEPAAPERSRGKSQGRATVTEEEITPPSSGRGRRTRAPSEYAEPARSAQNSKVSSRKPVIQTDDSEEEVEPTRPSRGTRPTSRKPAAKRDESDEESEEEVRPVRRSSSKPSTAPQRRTTRTGK